METEHTTLEGGSIFLVGKIYLQVIDLSTCINSMVDGLSPKGKNKRYMIGRVRSIKVNHIMEVRITIVQGIK